MPSKCATTSKTCVMTSHVRHSERGSVISYCLVCTVICSVGDKRSRRRRNASDDDNLDLGSTEGSDSGNESTSKDDSEPDEETGEKGREQDGETGERKRRGGGAVNGTAAEGGRAEGGTTAVGAGEDVAGKPTGVSRTQGRNRGTTGVWYSRVHTDPQILSNLFYLFILCAGPTLWNALPEDIRMTVNINAFKAQLKTHYFKVAFN